MSRLMRPYNVALSDCAAAPSGAATASATAILETARAVAVTETIDSVGACRKQWQC
jgi:hypothetical protein